MFSIKTKARLSEKICGGLHAHRRSCPRRKHDQFRKNDPARASNIQVRNRPLGLDFLEGSRRVIASCCGKEMHIGHIHDDLAGCADAEVGDVGLDCASVDGEGESGLDPSGRQSGGKAIGERMLHHTWPIWNGCWQRGWAAQRERQGLRVQRESHAHRRRCRCGGIGHMNFDESRAISNEREITLCRLHHVGLAEINRIDCHSMGSAENKQIQDTQEKGSEWNGHDRLFLKTRRTSKTKHGPQFQALTLAFSAFQAVIPKFSSF